MHLSATDARPRVLHLTQPVDGGVAQVVTDLVRAQLTAGLRVAVACPDSELSAVLGASGAEVRNWRATRSPGPTLPAEVRGLARVLGEVRPDLVHAHSAKAGLAGRIAVRGRIPTVFQPHAWSFEAVGGATSALALKWERWGARWASRVVCVSEAERATGERAGIAGRWSVIPNGIDPGRFRPAAVDTVRAALGLRPATAATGRAALDGNSGDGRDQQDGQDGQDSQDGDPHPPLVVCVGRLCRQKGQDVLLDAWDAVLRRMPAARLVLVGAGPEGDRLRARAPRSVLFAGAVTDPVPWYQAADLVVLPSRWEGMALAPLEAMACGRPVLVTDVDGARESLPAALAGHCLVPPGDPGALAAAVTRLLLDPPLRASLGRQGRRHALATHDVRHTAAAVAALYHDLLGGEPNQATGRVVPTEYRESIHP